jgi:hypothetical protein
MFRVQGGPEAECTGRLEAYREAAGLFAPGFGSEGHYPRMGRKGGAAHYLASSPPEHGDVERGEDCRHDWVGQV